MPRYDLMHWSQRVRDQQAANARTIPPAQIAPAASTNRPSKPRVARPKPPRDEDAEHLLRFCREGRLFELQEWLGAGKPLTVPAYYRHAPLHVALDTGFHSLIELLLQHETEQAVKDEVLRQACWRGQRSVMRLALTYGASISAVSFQDVVETWDREVVQIFVAGGADLVTNAPFAHAFKARVKAALGIFLDCKRARPDLAEALQKQVDMALRQACQDDDLKWVSLLMWLGANPRTKGLTTEDLDSSDAVEDADDRQSALQIACRRKPEILKRLKPDPALDDLRELIAAATSLVTTPETVAYLVRLGADINDKADGGSTVLDTCLRNFAWKEMVWDHWHRNVTVPISNLGQSLAALRFVIEKGARWTPDDRSIADTRRSLYRVEGEAIAVVLDLLRKHQACDETVLTALVRTDKIRSILAGVAQRRASAERRAKPIVSRRESGETRQPRAETALLRLPPSRYKRERLYEEVWTEPTQKVAERYGVSDVAIAKACALLDIPKPPRGYWNKKAAGHKLPERPPLKKYHL